ncbi:MAG: O-antigen ligase family protein [Clostridiales bacterium]|nr:O-antigen ligase family protein [Clostridiales bacterium]
MIQYRNGLLKIKNKESPLDVLWDIGLFLFMLSAICYGKSDETNNFFYYFVFFFFLGISAFYMIFRGRPLNIFIPLHTLWYGLFLLLCLVSSIWAVSFPVAFTPISRMIQILAITMCLLIYIDNEEKIERYLDIVVAASVYTMIYIYVMTPPSQWFDGFLGSVTGYNTNDIGCAFTICVLITFYKGFIRQRRIAYIICILSFLTVILTSSRKSLFMCVAGIVLIVIFNYRKKNYILYVLSTIGLMALLLVLIYQIPSLYRTVGVRIDSMIDYFLFDKSADSSIAIREFYINTAKSMFFEKPLLGYGINNFVYVSGRIGHISTYAHNNYWEIAADLGIVGLITYYWFYVFLFIKLFKQVIDGHKQSLLFFSIIVLLLIFEYSMINYYKFQIHILIAAVYMAAVVNDAPPSPALKKSGRLASTERRDNDETA